MRISDWSSDVCSSDLFAIGAHRQKRAKAIVANPLDDVPGIGPARKRALLMHFGTARAVREAALEDLEKAPGISRTMARAIHDHFHVRDRKSTRMNYRH